MAILRFKMQVIWPYVLLFPLLLLHIVKLRRPRNDGSGSACSKLIISLDMCEDISSLHDSTPAMDRLLGGSAEFEFSNQSLGTSVYDSTAALLLTKCQFPDPGFDELHSSLFFFSFLFETPRVTNRVSAPISEKPLPLGHVCFENSLL
jgi:hypothetical protein